MEDANDEYARVVLLEEDAVTAALGHQDARPEVTSFAREHRTANQALHRVAQSIHVFAGLVSPPCPSGVTTNLGEIRSRDLGEDQAFHRLANRASISSSV